MIEIAIMVVVFGNVPFFFLLKQKKKKKHLREGVGYKNSKNEWMRERERERKREKISGIFYIYKVCQN
jgi:hypothetical protein